MSKITGTGVISSIDLYSSDTVAQHDLGALFFGTNGTAFRYVLAGASALVVGNVIQAKAQDTQFENMGVAAASTGATSVTVTNGSTAVTTNEFSGGSVSVYTTPGLCEEYKVIGNTAEPNGSGTFTVYLDTPIRTAWTTSTKINLKWSPYYAVIQFPASTQTGIPVGVATYAIPASQYGWIQSKGVSGVLSDGSTFAVGSQVGTPSSTAGAATVYAAGTTHSIIGTAQQAAASGHGISVNLQID